MSETNFSSRSTEELTAAADILYISIELFLECLESDVKVFYKADKLDEESVKKFANDFPALGSFIAGVQGTYLAFCEELRKRQGENLH
ncbi:MAG TPA: hypothetical protein V6C58_24330 [Allocoleopsis sp.]